MCPHVTETKEYEILLKQIMSRLYDHKTILIKHFKCIKENIYDRHKINYYLFL